MNGQKLIITLAVSAMLFTGCGIKSAQTIIKVNNTNITQAQFDKIFDKDAKSSLNSPMHIDIKDERNSFMANLIKNRIVNELIVKALLDEEAEKRGIKVTNDDLNNAIKDIVDKVGSKERLDEMIKQNGMTANDFKEDLKNQVKMKKLAESIGNSDVSDAEIKDFYNKNIDKFRHPEVVRASHILIKVDPRAIAESIREANPKMYDDEIEKKVNEEIQAKQAKANDLYEKAKKDPSSFAKLAQENSEDPGSATRGGELGFFAKKDMVPEFANASFNAKPNTIVGPIRTAYGYHIIYVQDRKAAGQEPLEKVKNNIKEHLVNTKQLEQIDNLVESLKKEAKIEFVNKEYDPEEIQKAVQKNIEESGEMAKRLMQESKAKETEKK